MIRLQGERLLEERYGLLRIVPETKDVGKEVGPPHLTWRKRPGIDEAGLRRIVVFRGEEEPPHLPVSVSQRGGRDVRSIDSRGE